MPCILKIKVIGARDLPVMDKASDLTDAYVEVRFADFEAQRTTVCRKTLNPVWNEASQALKFNSGTSKCKTAGAWSVNISLFLVMEMRMENTGLSLRSYR